MAKVLGESGRYVTDQSARKWRRQFQVALLTVSGTSLACGFYFGYVEHSNWRLPLSAWPVLGAAGIVFWLIHRVGIRRWDELENERISFRKGATGEAVVARVLGSFPDDYVVINDLATPFGNLDHVVIGPTGVFLIETKNWKGMITADGKGDIVLNGKVLDKPVVKPLVRRIMDIREKVATLCNGSLADMNGLPWFKGVLVFPSAWVGARWGETGNADCVTEEKTWDYIVESKMGKVLERRHVIELAKAFRALAEKEKEFKSDRNETQRAHPLSTAIQPSGRAVAAEAA